MSPDVAQGARGHPAVTEPRCPVPTPMAVLLGPSLPSLACTPKTALPEVPLPTGTLNPPGPQALQVPSAHPWRGASAASCAPHCPLPRL